jgi:hypothetical protein
MAVPSVTAAFVGVRIRTFTVRQDAGDAGVDTVAAHGLGGQPIWWKITDTTVGGVTQGSCWTVHTVGVANFTVRKACATAGDRTALVVLAIPHSIEA